MRTHVQRSIALIAAVGALMSGSAASASEQSRRLSARGLVEFHAQRYSQALDFFERAVDADSSDPYALYYRGVTRARLGNVTGAIADLRAVVKKWVTFRQAQLELGIALVQGGEYREAITWLEQAQAAKQLDGRASLFLGIAQLRVGDLEVARRNFERAATRDPSLTLSARYYEGVVAYREGKWAQAEDHFDYVNTASPNSDMGREAATFLSLLRNEQLKTLVVYGALGFEYDSNVVLAPSNEALKNATESALGISNQADGRGTINAGGVYVPWSNDWGQLALGYDFYQSLHIDLTEFNLQDHRPSVQLIANAGPVEFGLLGRYDYYFLETDSFLQEGNGLPWVAVPEGDIGRTEVFYRVRRRDFFKQDFRLLDAFNHSTGVRQLLYLGSSERYVAIGYRFDSEQPTRSDGEVFAYDGNEGNIGIAWVFPAAIRAEASYAYRYEDYAAASNGRHDNEQQFVVVIRKDLGAHFDLMAGYFGTLNDSNKALFDYDRHIGSLALEVRY